MAYVSQELKKKLAVDVKAILKKYNVKGTLSVDNHSTLVLKIKSGPIDFIENYKRIAKLRARDEYDATQAENVTCINVNVYWFKEHFDGAAREFLTEVHSAMNKGNFDHSDLQTDYFHVGWWTDIKIGTWDKQYQVTA